MVKTVWYVDDDQEMQQALKLMLKLLGYQMRAFLTARDAVKILQYGDRPDVLILDINMPEISGLDLLEYIRRQAEWQNLPIVMLSTEFDDHQIARALKLGANSYVTKPVTLEELEAVINQAVEKQQPHNP